MSAPLQIPARAVQSLRGLLARSEGDTAFAAMRAAEAEVIARFQPGFLAPSQLDPELLRAFLYFENNRHWSGLHRQVNRLVRDMRVTRAALSVLLDEPRPLAERLDDACERVVGLGPAIATAYMLIARPRHHGVLNNASIEGLRRMELLPERWERMSHGERYAAINPVLLALAKELGLSLWTLDALLWAYVGDAAGSAVQADPAPASRDVRGVLAEGLKDSEQDRRVRELAEAQARALIEENLGRLTEAQLRQVMTHLNTCQGAGGVVFTRFQPAFMGKNANSIVSVAERLNPLIEELWRAQEDAAVVHALDRFWAADVPGAGRSFPSALLYLRDPGRFAVWTRNLDETLHRILGRPFTRPLRRGDDYLRYCAELQRLRAEYQVPPALHDKALWLLGTAVVAEDEEGGSEPTPGGDGKPRGGSDVGAGLTVDALAAETFVGPGFFQELDRLLRDKRQLILFGPPGTGKTHVALRYAEYLAQGGGDVTTVQFHPSYGYEDFVEGLRPVVERGQLQYRVEPGVFRQVCDRARAKPSARFVLLIDELNRGNLPRIFGELLFLLERRGGPEVVLPASKQRFNVPENVIVLGTMNSADRSIALLDQALRRRFHFVEVLPDESVLRAWLLRHGREAWVADLLVVLNTALEAAGVEQDRFVGHSYFMTRELDLESVWKSSIEPLLRELFFSEPERLKAFSLEQMRKGVDAHLGRGAGRGT